MTSLAAAALAAQVLLSPCVIEFVPGQVRCGSYKVWEDRDAKQGRQIELSIIVLAALEPNPQPDPYFMLAGGPGDAPSFNARFFSRVFHDVRRSRDIVLVDLRGTGRSAALTCPELAQPGPDGVFDGDLLSVAAVRACRARLEKTADLRQYTTEIAVDDLEDVRQALGYPQINLYGTSYGSRVAQVYMRRHPASLRAVTMKGIVPPSMAVPESHAPAGEKAWKAVVARCRRDRECHLHYPNLDTNFRRLLSRLEKEAPVLDKPATPQQPAAKIKVTRGLFAEAFRNILYTAEGSAQAPFIVLQLISPDWPMIAGSALGGRIVLGGERLAAGFFLSVTCTEDIPYLARNADAKARGTFGGNYRLQQQRAACNEWPRGSVSRAHRQPTRSNIPTLLISGDVDPVTPPAGGAEVLKHLPRGRHVVIANNGHPIGNSEGCIGRMVRQFLDRGSADGLDTSCAAEMAAPPFSIPGKHP
jgi:pimeloyl-ACP methyl ester carboxylesterase